MASLANILRNFISVRFAGQAHPVRHNVDAVAGAQPFNPVGLGEFLALEIPPRAMLLNSILPERSLSMLFAPRGVGKSWLGLSIGLAVANGSPLLRWTVPRPRRVLYVDGEMLLCDLQARLNLILAGLGREMPHGNFSILAADNTEGGINLGSPEGQQALERYLDGVNLLVLDNLSTLLASGSEAASDAWLPIQNWLLHLRRKGIAVLIIHHAGVNGRQRGTSRREDALDVVIALRRPQNYSTKEGAQFEVHFEKLRQLAGEEALPFEAAVEPFVSKSGAPGIRWVSRNLEPPVFERATALFQAGKTVRQVAEAMGVSRSEAGRLRQRAEAEGLLDLGGEEEEDSEPEMAIQNHSRPN